MSTMLLAGSLLAQNAGQPSAQQSPEAAQQPQQQSQPAAAQPSTATAPAATSTTQEQQAQQPQPAQPSTSGGTSINPSQGPLQPVQPVTTYPDASGAQQGQPGANPQTTNVPEGPQPKKQPTEPVGAAAAESVPTAGGAAAKPAGVAIAPAKQHQTRSLLFKIGAVAAAGAALGAVFALSHSSPSTPPGAGTPGAMPR